VTSIHRHDAAIDSVSRSAAPSHPTVAGGALAPSGRGLPSPAVVRGADRSASAAAVSDRSAGRTAFAALVVGMVAAAVSWAASWVPSFGGGEGASIMSADRTWSSLVSEVSHVDVGNLVYVVLLHGWIVTVGDTPGAIRLASALAVGAAAAGIVVVVRGFAGERLAIVSALVFAVLPRTTDMGGVATSSALATACAVWLCVLFARLAFHAPQAGSARRRDRAEVTPRLTGSRPAARVAGLRGTVHTLPWVGFGLAFALCIVVQSPLALLAVVFGIVLAWAVRHRVVATAHALRHPRLAVAATSARDRAVIGRWFVVSVAGIALAAPVVVLDLVQDANSGGAVSVAGTGVSATPPALGALVSAWFGSDPASAVLVAGMLLALVVAFLVFARHGTLRSAMRVGEPTLVVFAASWLVLPSAVLFAMGVGTFEGATAFTTPALAVLLGVAVELGVRGVVAAGHRSNVRGIATAGAGLGVLAVAACAAPAYAAQRAPFAHGSDWAQVGDVIQQHAKAGDDIVFDEATAPLADPRIALHLYPEQFVNVVDVTLRAPYVDGSGLWDTTYSVPNVASRIDAGDGRVWVVEPRASSTAAADQLIAQLHALGFGSIRSYALHSDTVDLLTRGKTS
jgi:mannosyltransferase